MTSTNSPGSRRIVIALALLVVALTTFFHRQFISGDALIYGDDAAQLQYPRYRILCDTLQGEHALPIWQNLLYGGGPFHASPENPTLYPPLIVLASLFSPVWTINLMIVLHLAIAGLGMYFLILNLWRRIGQEGGEEREVIAAAGACVGATVFALNFFTRLSHTDYVSYGAAVALGPWLLLAAEKLLHGQEPRRAAGVLALLVAAEVFTGGVFVIPYTLLALTFWLFFQGIAAGREQGRRALVYGSLAVALAATIVMAKYLPYHEWVVTTNRLGRLSYEEARAAAELPGWSLVWKRVSWATGGGWTLGLALLALPLLRHGVVRLIFAGAIFFFLVYLGGPVHRFLYDWVPLFDRVRNILRAWTGVNLFYPIAAGLGVCWLFSRFAWSSRPRAAASLGAGLAIALSPLLAYSYRIDALMRHPDRYSEILTRYTQWPKAAERCGRDWRAVYFDKREPDGRNEQFISTALRVETVAGYLGHVWPTALERHIYGLPDSRLEFEVRLRRLGTLSVRALVLTDTNIPEGPRAKDVIPQGFDGTTVVDNPHARPRAIVPGAVIGLRGDDDHAVGYALIDDPRFPIERACAIDFETAQPIPAEERAALDALVVVVRDGERDGKAIDELTAPLSKPIAVHSPLTPEDREKLAALVSEVAAKAASHPGLTARFTRESSGSTRIELPQDSPSAAGRFVVVSEPWSWYSGWQIRAEGLGELQPIRRADAINSAVWLPARASAFEAQYRPLSVRLGGWIGALGLVLALGVIAWPGASAARRAS